MPVMHRRRRKQSWWMLVPVVCVMMLTPMGACSDRPSAMELVRAGRLEEALEAFSEQARMSGAAHDFYNMALAAAQLGRDEQVEDALVEALFVKPDFADAWINLGVFFQQRDEAELALHCYHAAARISGGRGGNGGTRALALYNIGAISLRTDEVSLAHGAYLAALKANPQLAIALDGLGAVALRRGQFKEAQTILQQALTLQPDMAEAYFNLANLERRRGNAKRALGYLEKCTASTPRGSSSPKIFWAQVYNNLGGALHALGRYTDALPAFDKAIRQLPEMVMAYVNKAEAQRILGNWTEAIACTRTALSLDPRHGVALSNHLMYKQNVCDWNEWDTLHARLVDLLRVSTITRADVSEEALPTVSPYQVVVVGAVVAVMVWMCRCRCCPGARTCIDVGVQCRRQGCRMC
jgi:tetratricopeptide (TPR) repeat protein